MAESGKKSPGDVYKIQKIWVNTKKGLRKEVISFKFTSITKASDISKCCVSITEITGLKENQESKYLRDKCDFEYWIKLGDAVTPIDCYIELFLKQMLTNETSRCSIKTKSDDVVSFVIKLQSVDFGGYYFNQPLPEIVSLAQHYKENGVQMYKKWPLFAHEYFNKAAKLLISLQPFDTLCERTEGMKEADPIFLRDLLENIYMNIAACLIKEQRYDDALHVLEFTDRPDNVPEKAIYRRALAYYHSHQFKEAKETLERIDYQNNKECNALHANAVEKMKESQEKYTDMVKKMFS